VVGTAESIWKGAELQTLDLLWTRGDSTTLSFRAAVRPGGPIEVRRGDERSEWDIPTGPWAIADYGMEDQLVPVLEAVPDDQETRLAIYRPVPSRWDTVTVSVTSALGAKVVTVMASSGERFRWVLSPAGLIVRITRDRHSESERRPLELTPPFADYLRWRALGEF
jgi:hypothetical protein